MNDILSRSEPWRAEGCTCEVTESERTVLPGCPVHGHEVAHRRGHPFEAVTSELASWPAPAWAVASRVDGDLTHYCWGRAVQGLDDQGAPVAVLVHVEQVDRLALDGAGRITVTRQGEPMLVVDGGLRLTVGQARELVASLAALVEVVDR